MKKTLPILAKSTLVVTALASALTLQGCWLVAAGAGAEAGYVASQDERTAKQTVQDQGITAAVKTKLLADNDVSGLDINVDTFKSVVTLRGFVESEQEASKAIALAQSVNGVTDVKSRLILK